MKLASISIALTLMLSGSPALAENWVTVVDGEDIGASVDKDSIQRGSDNLVFFMVRKIDRSDSAVDCQNRVIYTLKQYITRTIFSDNPNWRNEGRAVEPSTIGDFILQYVCANAP